MKAEEIALAFFQGDADRERLAKAINLALSAAAEAAAREMRERCAAFVSDPSHTIQLFSDVAKILGDELRKLPIFTHALDLALVEARIEEHVECCGEVVTDACGNLYTCEPRFACSRLTTLQAERDKLKEVKR